MKKIFLTLTAVLFAGILFTSASPSLDGRAVVAAEGVFPRGYFAKTVGYLPGDSIKVTNPVNGERIDILVIGSLDASDGVAILLSPEAAAALSIKRNSNNLVKLTKRNGTADDVVSGSALITRSEDAEAIAEELEQEEIEAEEIALAEDEENEAEEIPESAIDYSEDLTLAEDEAEEAEEIAEAEDEISDENPFDEVVLIEDEIPEDEVLEDNAEELAQEEIEADEIALAEDEENGEDEAEEEEAEEIAEVDEEIPEENDFGEFVLADEIPEDEIFEENIAEEYVRVEDEIPEESAEFPPEYEYVVADDILEDSLESEDSSDFSERVNEEEIPEEFAYENELEKVEEVEIAEEFAESDLAENEISENPAEDEAEEIPELADTEENLLENEEYEAIVLVPSEENPPAPREEIEDKKEIASSEKSAPAEEKPAPKSERSYVAATELAPRKYYVQIAVYNEAENVEEVNELYGKRYPLVVLEKGRRKTVMVGPFNVDEYGIILERFKAYGFKDAFVKSTF